MERLAVLLMAYGGPNSLEDLPAYLADVRHGRPYSPELLADLTERYRAIGGRSPILELTLAQARGVERILRASEASDGATYRVYVGMRHWHPYIHEVVPEILHDGADRLVGIVMAPPLLTNECWGLRRALRGSATTARGGTSSSRGGKLEG